MKMWKNIYGCVPLMLTDILGKLGQRKSEWRKIIMTQSRKLSQVTLFDGIFNFHVSTCAKLAYHPLLTATLSFLWYPHPHDLASFPSFLKKKITPPPLFVWYPSHPSAGSTFWMATHWFLRFGVDVVGWSDHDMVQAGVCLWSNCDNYTLFLGNHFARSWGL